MALFAAGAAIFGFMKAGQTQENYDEMESSLTAQLNEVSAALEEARKPVLPLDSGHPAIKYLDGTFVFSKEEMSEYPELDGLWNALNTYDYTAVASYFPLLQMSDTYSQVLMRIKSKKKIFDSNFDSGRTFVDDGEDGIALFRYLFALR